MPTQRQLAEPGNANHASALDRRKRRAVDAGQLLAAPLDEDAVRELATALEARFKQARYAANAAEARRAEGLAREGLGER